MRRPTLADLLLLRDLLLDALLLLLLHFLLLLDLFLLFLLLLLLRRFALVPSGLSDVRLVVVCLIGGGGVVVAGVLAAPSVAALWARNSANSPHCCGVGGVRCAAGGLCCVSCCICCSSCWLSSLYVDVELPDLSLLLRCRLPAGGICRTPRLVVRDLFEEKWRRKMDVCVAAIVS